MPAIFVIRSHEGAVGLATHLGATVKAPYVYATASTLGGLSKASIIIKVSLDHRSKWHNGIFQNSRYAMFHLSGDGTLEQFSKHYKLPKMRKSKAKSLPDAVKKIQAYLTKARKVKL